MERRYLGKVHGESSEPPPRRIARPLRYWHLRVNEYVSGNRGADDLVIARSKTIRMRRNRKRTARIIGMIRTLVIDYHLRATDRRLWDVYGVIQE